MESEFDTVRQSINNIQLRHQIRVTIHRGRGSRKLKKGMIIIMMMEIRNHLSGSGGGKWEWRGEKKSRERFRDLKLSFFSDCGSTGSISSVGPGIFFLSPCFSLLKFTLGLSLYHIRRERERERERDGDETGVICALKLVSPGVRLRRLPNVFRSES